MKNIHIPDPCHENWNEMTPTQRGAFCQKCSVDVYDFSKKTEREIHQIMIAYKGKHLCGRFKKSQLEEMNNDFLQWKNQNRKTFQSKFILALMIVFGLTLFSCNEEEAKVVEEIRYENLKAIHAGDPTELSGVDQLAQLVYQNQAENSIHAFPDPPTIHISEIMTDSIYEMNDSIEFGATDHHTMIAGGLRATETYIQYAKLKEKEKKDSSDILPTDILQSDEIFETKAFPNPTKRLSNVQLKINQRAQFDIQLYSMTGQMIQNVHSGELSEGEQRFQIDLSGRERGLYLITIISGNQKETLKIQKL